MPDLDVSAPVRRTQRLWGSGRRGKWGLDGGSGRRGKSGNSDLGGIYGVALVPT